MNKQEICEKIRHIIDAFETKNEDYPQYKCLIKRAAIKLTQADANEGGDFMEYLDGVFNYANFVTEKEYEELIAEYKGNLHFKNLTLLKEKLEKANKKTEHKGHFNYWALALVMNNIMRDHSEVIIEYVDEENIEDFVYDFAVSKLCSRKWLRNYYHLDE